ncbi:Leucine-rich repeat-containing N-terminal, plant-type, partial [Dillenia turbinata]
SQAMGGSRWSSYGFKLLALFVLIILLEFQQCSSLNPEGQSLLKFRERVHSDPYGAFANWNANDDNPCMWFGVHCEDGTVHMLDLYGLSLEGTLAPELGELSHLRSIVLYKNHFSGAIPKQVSKLSMLEQLDLRFNNLSGTIPAEIGEMQLLRRLLLSGNKFEDHFPPELSKLNLLHGFQCDQNLTSTATGGAPCVSRKIGHCMWQSSFNHLNNWNTFSTFKGALAHYLNVFQLFKTGKDSSPDNRENYCNDLPRSSEPFADENVHNSVMFVRRRLLEESKNLPALPAPAIPPSGQTTSPIARSSGSFPAVADAKKTSPPPATISNPPSPPAELDPPPSINDKANGFKRTYLWVGIGLGILVIVFVAICCLRRGSNVKPIGPWQTGLSGQLQKAFVSGVPKLNRQELETACEDFSNIISTLPACTIFKGTLSSGVEIAVVSPPIERFKDWSERAELIYRKKIETLSRVNHKNFVNLLGYCEENEPFLRMMVYEYAPNGTLFEHLHGKIYLFSLQ